MRHPDVVYKPGPGRFFSKKQFSRVLVDKLSQLDTDYSYLNIFCQHGRNTEIIALIDLLKKSGNPKKELDLFQQHLEKSEVSFLFNICLFESCNAEVLKYFLDYLKDVCDRCVLDLKNQNSKEDKGDLFFNILTYVDKTYQCNLLNIVVMQGNLAKVTVLLDYFAKEKIDTNPIIRNYFKKFLTDANSFGSPFFNICKLNLFKYQDLESQLRLKANCLPVFKTLTEAAKRAFENDPQGFKNFFLSKNDKDETAFYAACSYGTLDLVKELLQETHYTILVDKEPKNFRDEIIDRFFQIQTTTGLTPLIRVCNDSKKKEIFWLLWNFAKKLFDFGNQKPSQEFLDFVFFEGKDKITAFQQACATNQIEIVKVIITDIAQLDQKKSQSYPHLRKLLLHTNSLGRLSIFTANTNGYHQIVKILMSAAVWVFGKNSTEYTAYSKAKIDLPASTEKSQKKVLVPKLNSVTPDSFESKRNVSKSNPVESKSNAQEVDRVEPIKTTSQKENRNSSENQSKKSNKKTKQSHAPFGSNQEYKTEDSTNHTDVQSFASNDALQYSNDSTLNTGLGVTSNLPMIHSQVVYVPIVYQIPVYYVPQQTFFGNYPSYPNPEGFYSGQMGQTYPVTFFQQPQTQQLSNQLGLEQQSVDLSQNDSDFQDSTVVEAHSDLSSTELISSLNQVLQDSIKNQPSN